MDVSMPRRNGLWIVVGALSIAGTAVLAGTVSANECRVGCNLQKRQCIDTARVTKLACKLDCREDVPAGELGTCMRTCVDTFRAAKDTCRADHTDCRSVCTPPDEGTPPADEACLAACGGDLAACARAVVGLARDCVGSCATAPDRLVCLEGCAATAVDGGEACATAFTGCVTDCGVGSPSGAFLGVSSDVLY